MAVFTGPYPKSRAFLEHFLSKVRLLPVLSHAFLLLLSRLVPPPPELLPILILIFTLMLILMLIFRSLSHLFEVSLPVALHEPTFLEHVVSLGDLSFLQRCLLTSQENSQALAEPTDQVFLKSGLAGNKEIIELLLKVPPHSHHPQFLGILRPNCHPLFSRGSSAILSQLGFISVPVSHRAVSSNSSKPTLLSPAPSSLDLPPFLSSSKALSREEIWPSSPGLTLAIPLPGHSARELLSPPFEAWPLVLASSSSSTTAAPAPLPPLPALFSKSYYLPTRPALSSPSPSAEKPCGITTSTGPQGRDPHSALAFRGSPSPSRARFSSRRAHRSSWRLGFGCRSGRLPSSSPVPPRPAGWKPQAGTHPR